MGTPRLDQPAIGRNRTTLLACATLLGSLLGFLVFMLVRPDRFGMADLAVYRTGAEAVVGGHPLYPHQGHDAAAFTYPPFAALALIPLALVPWPVAQLIAAVGSAACLAWCIRICLASTRLPTEWLPTALPGVLAAVLWLEPVRSTLELGQVNLVLMALVLADLTGRTGRLPRGVLVGVAAGLKLTPAIFGLYLLLTGQRRAAGTALASFAATVGVGYLLLPGDSRAFWGLIPNPARLGGVAYVGNEGGMQYISNQSLHGATVRLLGGPSAARPAWLACAAVIGLAGLLLAAAAARSGRPLAGIALCGLTGLLVSPISWSHHWVWVLPGVIAVGAEAWLAARSTLLMLAGGAFALFAAAPIWWVPSGAGREYDHHGVQLLVGNAYLLAGLAALGLVAGYRLSGGRPTGRRPTGPGLTGRRSLPPPAADPVDAQPGGWRSLPAGAAAAGREHP